MNAALDQISFGSKPSYLEDWTARSGIKLPSLSGLLIRHHFGLVGERTFSTCLPKFLTKSLADALGGIAARGD